MKYIITERQYRIITEQTDNVDWLINWFKKVPEKKLIQTFTVKNKDGSETRMTRNDILKLLSDKSRIVILTDPNEIARVLGTRLAMFQYTWDPKYSDIRDKKYTNKVVINGLEWKNILKNDPQYQQFKNLDDLKHHEQIHLIQNAQKNGMGDWNANASKTISGFCKGNSNSMCKEDMWYHSKPEEIYGHLFTMREFLGIEPIDTVTDASVTISRNIATINVTVSRNGKTIKLPTKTLSTKSSTFITLYCCNNSFKQTLMYLHNTLAKNNNPNNSELGKMV